MAALVISISSDVSVESVGTAAVASPVGVLELDTHSLSEVDSFVSSPPLEDIPIGRLYRTYPGRQCRALTTRNSVRRLPSHCLALRYTSHHLDHFTFGSSSCHSSSDHSSSGHSILGHSLPGHASLDTIIPDSSTPSRFVHPLLARTPGCSEAYLRWRSFAAIVTSSIYATRALVISRADLLPPRKRQGHYRIDCPKLKDQNHGNKTGNKNGVGEAGGKAYVIGGGDTNPSSNVVMEKYQVKYATCTLLNSTLTWWNSHKRTIKADNLTMKNNDLATYTQRIQELTMMYTNMVLEEEDQVEKFIGGLLDKI
nr:hypothetical protein [Tanacetum cinerariifolium]